MHQIISRLSGLSYKYVLKPVLFKFKPDLVHDSLLSNGSRLQKYRLVKTFISKTWAYQNEPVLGQEILGIKFINPVGLSAGFDKNIELAPLLKSVGFGFMEGGSLTFEPCIGNPRPWFYRLPKTSSLVVYAGLANQGVETIAKRLQNYPADTFNDFPINVSIAKTNSKTTCSDQDAIADYVGSLKLLDSQSLGNIYTLNISCPNTYGGEPFTTPERLEALLNATDNLNLKVPLLIKMPSHLTWADFAKLLRVANHHKVQGLIISNLAKDRTLANLKDPLPDSVKGNLSGKPTESLSNNLIQRTYQLYGKRFVIVGVGGIFSAEDAYKKIKLGASLVELITGMIFNGPQLIGQINYGLAQLLAKDGYDNIGQAVGSEAKYS